MRPSDDRPPAGGRRATGHEQQGGGARRLARDARHGVDEQLGVRANPAGTACAVDEISVADVWGAAAADGWPAEAHRLSFQTWLMPPSMLSSAPAT